MAKLKKTGTIHPTVTGYDFRLDKPLRPLRSMRVKCLECQNNQPIEVRRCHLIDCSLWPHRMGACGPEIRYAADQEALARLEPPPTNGSSEQVSSGRVGIDPEGERATRPPRSGAQIAAARSNLAKAREK